jgi:hypothetical protein
MSVTTSTEARHDRRRLQQRTYAAPSWGAPWSAADDTELMTGQGTIADRAERLGRTYYAACYRLQVLREQAAIRRAELVAR